MRITPLESETRPQGQINTQQASASDFGVNLAPAGENLDATAEVIQQQADAKNKVWQANSLSSFQLQQYQSIQDAQTDPEFSQKYGPDGGKFVESYDDQFQQSASSLIDSAPDQRTKQALSVELAGIRTNMMAHAIGLQASIGGSYIKDQLTQSQDSDAQLVFMSPGDAGNVLDRGKRAIAGAPYLTPDIKRDMLTKYEQDISLAAGKGLVQRQPEAVLNALAPDELAKFRPTPRVLANTSQSVKGFGPPAPAAVSPQVNSYSTVTKQMAANYSVDANFLMAQQQVESKGNPNAVNNDDINVTGSPSIGLAQFQPATAARYGIDPKIPQQAIKGQAAYMSDLLTMFQGDYRKAAAGYNWGEGNVQKAIAQYGDNWLQHAPASTQEYLGKIFAIAQPTPTAGQSFDAMQAAQNTADPSRAGSNPDWFNRLDWKQQYQIVQDAKQGVNANQVRDSQMFALQKQQHEMQQQQTMNGMYDKLLDGSLKVDEVRNSPLDYQGKEHMIEAINKGVRGEAKTDPQVFNDLFERIHAPANDPSRIADDRALLPFVGNGLGFDDLNKLRGELKGRNTPDGATVGELKKNFFSMARKQIDTSIFGLSVDTEGAKQFYSFQQAALSYIDRKTRSGADVLDLFNPNSKDYVGNIIPQYTRTPQQQLNDTAKAYSTTAAPAAKPTVAARQAGESIADYQKRTGSAQ